MCWSGGGSVDGIVDISTGYIRGQCRIIQGGKGNLNCWLCCTCCLLCNGVMCLTLLFNGVMCAPLLVWCVLRSTWTSSCLYPPECPFPHPPPPLALHPPPVPFPTMPTHLPCFDGKLNPLSLHLLPPVTFENFVTLRSGNQGTPKKDIFLVFTVQSVERSVVRRLVFKSPDPSHTEGSTWKIRLTTNSWFSYWSSLSVHLCIPQPQTMSQESLNSVLREP